MKEMKKRYRRSFAVYLAGYALLYFFPLTIYLQLPDSMRNIRLSDHIGLLPFWSAAWLLLCIIHAAVRYARFIRQVRALSPAALQAAENSLDKCRQYRLLTGTIYLCDSVFYYSGGTAAEYSMIKEIEIRKSETDKLDVIHMYVYLHDGTKTMIPVGFRTLPGSFEAAIRKKHPGIEINRTYKSAFGKKQTIAKEDDKNEK